jgi:hypothetical protein
VGRLLYFSNFLHNAFKQISQLLIAERTFVALLDALEDLPFPLGLVNGFACGAFYLSDFSGTPCSLIEQLHQLVIYIIYTFAPFADVHHDHLISEFRSEKKPALPALRWRGL